MWQNSGQIKVMAGHQSVSDTDGGCCLELYSDVKLIIFLQKGAVNDIEEVLLMLRPVFLSQFSGYLGELSLSLIHISTSSQERTGDLEVMI